MLSDFLACTGPIRFAPSKHTFLHLAWKAVCSVDIFFSLPLTLPTCYYTKVSPTPVVL